MPFSKHQSNSQGQLVGVPKKKAPDLWWKIFFWPNAMGKHGVPEHLRSAGMCCPQCGKGQPFFDRCIFCGCVFSCFVAIETSAVPHVVRQSKKSAPRSTAEHDMRHRVLARLAQTSMRARTMAACVVVLLLVALAAGVVYHRNSERRRYAHNYVLALSLITSGMNLGKKVCDGTYNDWRGMESTSGGINPQAQADLESVTIEINKVMEKMTSPPAEFDNAARTLQRLNALYGKTASVITASGDSLPLHTAEIDAAQDEFSRKIQTLKTNMPAQLAEEIRKSGKKYDLKSMERDT